MCGPPSARSSIWARPADGWCAITSREAAGNSSNRSRRAMAVDRSVRSLSALEGASSSRVLNLVAIAEANADNEGHRTAPLFLSNILNRSLVLKHRLRADEVDFFPTRRALVTKIIIPFERTRLKCRRHSLVGGQLGFAEILQEAGNYKEVADLM